jgi:hypothetical protein
MSLDVMYVPQDTPNISLNNKLLKVKKLLKSTNVKDVKKDVLNVTKILLILLELIKEERNVEFVTTLVTILKKEYVNLPEIIA